MKPDVHTLKTKSKLSPEVEPFVPKLQKDQELAEEVAAPLGHLTLPNPYTPKALRGALLRNSGDQAVGGNVSPQTGDGLGKHGYNNSRRGRGAARRQADPARESSPLKKPGKTFSTPWPSPDLVSNDKVIRRPLGVAKAKQKVSRELKPTPEAAEKTKHPLRDADAFEIKQSDFPELSFPTPSKPALQHCWGSSTSLPSPYKQGQTGHSALSPSHAEKGEATQGSTLLSPGSLTASWASVASQPPRKPAPKMDRGLNSPTQEAKSEAEVEQTSEKRRQKKKKNKKKKSKPTSDEDEVKAGALLIEQEPPKFEDEDEFPDLALASSGKSEAVAKRNIKNRPNEMQEGRESLHQREGTGLPSADLGKTRAATGQHPPPAQSAEPRKAQPKAEKTSGKKSKVPVQLDLGNMLAVLEKQQLSQKSKQDPKSIILSVGGAIPVVHKDPSTQKKHPRQLERVAHNPLDSTSPLVKKGKQREVPKAKKPTPLKRIILKEREERKQHRLLEERGMPPQANDSEPSDHPAEAAQETLVLEQNQQAPTDGRATPFPEQPTEDRLVQSETELGEGTEEPSQEVASTEASLPCRPKIHSRKFRDYCSQVLSRDVDECVTGLLKELVRFQDRLYQKDPMKARMKRRLVMGLREVLKHLRLRKVKCVVISPNCERIQSKGGLDDALHTIIDTCREQAVPFVFALSRKALGRCVNKAVPVSLVGIFNYDGAQDLYHKMIELSSEARNAYEVMIANLEQTSQEQQETPTDCQNSVSTVDQSEIEEPEYIKVWKRMLEECSHHVLNFEAKLSFTAVASDSGPQPDEDERS